MQFDSEDLLSQECYRLPYPLSAPEGVEESADADLDEDAGLMLDNLEDHLRLLIRRWKGIAYRERGKLSAAHPSHDVPMEFRSGLAEGMCKAATDLERALGQLHHKA